MLLGYVGSIAHGTYVPKNDPDSIDDQDILGVCVAEESVCSFNITGESR
ncbi:MAG: hypothetical protein PHC61_12815 [Chitinivibrionales bacterium]|nr:hypothetical protein [Chitinivibrionales bacterium]